MQVTLNGEAQELADGVTVGDLIRDLGLSGRRFAVEVNLEILPRDTYAAHELHDGDTIEVVHFIGGG
jgi:thiamine biosynthesis protein ThiS